MYGLEGLSSHDIDVYTSDFFILTPCLLIQPFRRNRSTFIFKFKQRITQMEWKYHSQRL